MFPIAGSVAAAVAALASGNRQRKHRALRRPQEGGRAGTGPALVKDTLHLCLTLSDKTPLDTYCKDPVRYSEQV